MKHRDTHPIDVPGCWGSHVLGVQITTSSAGAAEVNERERRWDRDGDAYKRLRMNGLQPKAIDGCAQLETRATDQFEVEMGKVLPNAEDRKKAREGMVMAREMGL